MSQAIRRVMTCVLPVPAPATTSSGPSPWMTALRCSGLSPSSSCSVPVGRGRRRPTGGLDLAPDRDLDERLRARRGRAAPHAALRPARIGGSGRSGGGAGTRRIGGTTRGWREPVPALVSRLACGSGLRGSRSRRPARSAAPRPPRPTAPPRTCRRRSPCRRRGCRSRVCRLLTMNPSPCWSSSASAKLWLPPVSSNGLKRTSPSRWNAPALRRARGPPCGPPARPPRGRPRTPCRCGRRAMDSRLVPSPPRGQAGDPPRPAARRPPDQHEHDHDQHDA